MRIIKFILLFLILATAIIFIIQNMETVSLKFITWRLEIPLSAASVLLYVLGAFSGGLLFSILKKLTHENKKK